MKASTRKNTKISWLVLEILVQINLVRHVSSYLGADYICLQTYQHGHSYS